MNIIEPKTVRNSTISSIVKPVNESIINDLAQLALRIRRVDEFANFYSDLCVSKYIVGDLTSRDERLDALLQKMTAKYKKFRFFKEEDKYTWIEINSDRLEETINNFHIAPNPIYMHELIEKLSNKFAEKGVPVRIKYQQTFNMGNCDRIIIYSDNRHKLMVEETISDVYKENTNLFEGAERALPWLYDSSIPNVYLTTKTVGDSYEEKFSDTLVQAKHFFVIYMV